MTYSDTTNLILSKISDYGTQLVLILTAVIGIGLAYLIFSFGWSLVTGKSGMFTSMFPRLDRAIYKPYKGYNRFRSREWNLTHTA